MKNYLYMTLPKINTEKANEVNYKFEKWKNDNQPPKWQRFWLNKITGTSIFFTLFILTRRHQIRCNVSNV